MDEELWPVQQQPLALWSLPSVGSSSAHLPPPNSAIQPYSQPGCTTPMASPIPKMPPSSLPHHHPASSFAYSDQFGQSPYCSSPAQFATPPNGWFVPPPPSNNQHHNHHHHQQQPIYYPPPPPPSSHPHPPPPPYFMPHHHHAAPAAQFHQQEMFPASFQSIGPPNGNEGPDPSSLANNGREDGEGGGQMAQQQRDQRRCMASQQKVHQWQQFGTAQMALQDSGVHSMSQSTANSVMSMSSIHPVSCISGVSSLPDEYPALQEHPYFQNMPTSIRHEEPEKMRKVLPELIPLINDEAEEIVLRALTILSSIAKKDKELARGRTPLDGPLIGERRVVEELLRTLKTHKRNKKVAFYALRALHFISDNEPSGRELFVQTLTDHGTDCLEELVHCIGIQEYSCYKFAFLVLHNLMTDSRISRKVIAYMCEMRILTKVLGWLDDKNEKFLNIVTDIVHMLVSRNSEQMAFFLGLNGHQKLVHILAHSQQETLLYSTIKLLKRVVQIDPAKLVSSGLLEAAQKHLDQASQRLLRQILDCIRAASHVPSAGHRLNPLLQKLLQLLGTNDLRLKESCTDILANLSANNAQNKEFLVENGAIYGLFQLLHELEALKEALGHSQQREGIQERALALLRSLCSGNAQAGVAKRQCLGTDGHKRLLLERLRQKRNLPLLRRTLMLLQQLAQDGQEEDLLAGLHFALSFPPPFPQLPDAPLVRHSETCSFANQTVLLLHQAMNSLPENAEICQRSLDILRAMAKDGLLLEEIFAELRARRLRLRDGEGRLMAPQVLLCFYDQLAPNSVALLAELARIPQAAQMLHRDQSTLDSLQRWANSGTQTAQLAVLALQLIGTMGGDERQEEARRNCQQQQYFANYPPQNNLPPQQYPPAVHFGGEQLATTALNNSPAQMDFSPADAQLPPPPPPPAQSSVGGFNDGIGMSHPMANGGEQLAQFGQFPEFAHAQRQVAFSPPNAADDFSADFGPFVNALCPDPSPDWTNPRRGE